MKKINEIDELSDVDDKYFITTCGKIITLNSNGFKIGNGSLDSYGYLVKTLYLKENRKRKTFKVHRIVAYAYCENTERKETVNHNSEIKTDNYWQNLSWMTISENNKYGNRSVNAGNSNLNKGTSKAIIQYSKDGIFIKEWISASQIMRETDNKLLKGGISKCCNGKTKTYKNFIWKFKGDVNDESK